MKKANSKFVERFITVLPNSIIASFFSGMFLALICVIITTCFAKYNLEISQIVSILMVGSFGFGFIIAGLIGAMFSIIAAPISMWVFYFASGKNLMVKSVIFILGGATVGIMIVGAPLVLIYLPEPTKPHNLASEIGLLGSLSGIFGLVVLDYLNSKQKI